MRTFPMIDSPEVRAVAEGNTQTINALICCLALQGLKLEPLLEHLESYRTINSGTLNPVADEMISRTVLSLTNTVRDFPQKNV